MHKTTTGEVGPASPSASNGDFLSTGAPSRRESIKRTHDGITIAPPHEIVQPRPPSLARSPVLERSNSRATLEASASGTPVGAANTPTPLERVREKLLAFGIDLSPTFRFSPVATRAMNRANSSVRAENTRRLMVELLPAIDADPRLQPRGALEQLVQHLNAGLSNQPFYVASGHLNRAIEQARATRPQ